MVWDFDIIYLIPWDFFAFSFIQIDFRGCRITRDEALKEGAKKQRRTILMTTSEVSRRGFIAGLGAFSIGAAAVAAGCSAGKPQNLGASGDAADGTGNQGARELPEADETLEYDVVVIGSGMAGMSAAITAREEGAKVLLLESMSVLGGNTNFAEGMFAVGSSLQKEMGITDIDVESILEIEYGFQNYNVDPKWWEAVASNSAENIDWLISKGVVFDTVTSTGTNVPLTWHIFEGNHGDSAIAYLQKAAEAAGVDIMAEAPATALLWDGSSVEGVRAECGRVAYDIKAKSVIIACGGCGFNEEMIEAYTNRPTNKYYYRGGMGQTGFGLEAVQQITGERPKNITVCQIGLTVPETDIFSQLSTCLSMEPSNLWLNQDGQRFVTEGLTNYYTTVANAVQSQKEVFSIASQDCFDHYMNDGCDVGFGMFVLPGTKCTDLPDEVETYADNPHFYTADTVEELAGKIGLDADAVKASVEAYNALCAKKEDAEYGKSGDFMIALENGPFYAARIMPNVLNTMGGISIDHDCRVVDSDYNVVENLYCCGMDASGFQGETYGISISGSCQGVAVCTGRIAGQKAAEHAAA